MVTLTKYGAKYNRNILFLEGLSTDTKPTDEFDGLSIQNGSEYTEVDTGKKFLFDYDNATWYEVQTGGGGGGGGFTPTQAQLDAMNSGITAEKLQTDENNILLKQDKTWIKLKTVTTTSDTFELDLRGKSEFKIVLVHRTDIYEASAPADLIAAGYKLIVSHINSASPSTDIGTFVYNFSDYGTNDFTATIPSASYKLFIFAR